MRYQVLTDRVAGCDPGDFIHADDLAGCNIEALVTGGHVRPVHDEPSATIPEMENDE